MGGCRRRTMLDNRVTKALDPFWAYRASRRQVLRFVRRARHHIQWWHLENPRARELFTTNKPRLNPSQQEAADQLSARGLAIVALDKLDPDADVWGRLRTVVDTFSRSDKVRQGIADFRQTIAEGKFQNDVYLIKLYPEGPTLELDNPLLQLGLSPSILDVVNSYLGLWAKLLYTDVWHSIPIDVGHRIGSQRWHRDPEDRKIVKVYLYFGDVDKEAGAMEYVAGSTFGGPYESIAKWKVKGYHYLPEGEVERRVPPSAILSCVGPAGTAVFCDTSGIHRGNIATSRARILATWTFCTPAAISVSAQRRFTISPTSDDSRLSPAARYAQA